MDSCMRAYSTVQQLLCHGSYCELILSLARTSCRLLFTARPTANPLAGNPLRDAVRSRNLSKSTLAHDAVATEVLHKYHLIIRVGAGLIQFVYRSHLRLATEATRNRNVFSPFFARVFTNLSERGETLRHEGLGAPALASQGFLGANLARFSPVVEGAAVAVKEVHFSLWAVILQIPLCIRVCVYVYSVYMCIYIQYDLSNGI